MKWQVLQANSKQNSAKLTKRHPQQVVAKVGAARSNDDTPATTAGAGAGAGAAAKPLPITNGGSHIADDVAAKAAASSQADALSAAEERLQTQSREATALQDKVGTIHMFTVPRTLITPHVFVTAWHQVILAERQLTTVRDKQAYLEEQVKSLLREKEHARVSKCCAVRSSHTRLPHASCLGASCLHCYSWSQKTISELRAASELSRREKEAAEQQANEATKQLEEARRYCAPP